MKRLSTLTFGRRAAALLPNGARLLDALSSPMIVDILETMDSHESAIFFILGPVQFFKSAVGQLVLARRHALRPRDSAWYAPTVEFAKDFADFKLNPLLDAQPQFRPHPAKDIPARPGEERPMRGDLVLEDKNKLSRLRRTYCTAGHLLLSANNENDRTGKTFVDIYCDEPHLYEPGWIQQISNRRKDYEDEYTETYMSTGLTIGQTAKGGEAAALWATTDQRLWHVRCPACNKLFEPRYLHREKENDQESPIIGGLIYTRALLENGLPDKTAISSTLVYQCPRCRVARLPDAHGSRVALSGTAAAPRGLYISQNSHAQNRRYGWNFNAIAGRSWIEIVMDFELAQLARARGDIEPLGRVIREHFGGLWDPEQHLRTKKAIATGDYPMGQDWAEEMIDDHGRPVRCLTVDVQTDRYYVVIRMWAKNGASRLRHAECVTSPSRIRDLQLEHRVINDRVYLDARHDPDHVKQIAARYAGASGPWRVLLGDKDKDWLHPIDGTRRIYSEARWEDPFKGTIHQGSLPEVPVILFSKQRACSRHHMLRTMAGADGKPLWSTANNAPAEYNSAPEHYRKRCVTPEGEVYHVWAGFHDDHFPDCEVMQVVFASMAGLIGSESLESAATDAPQKPQLKVES